MARACSHFGKKNLSKISVMLPTESMSFQSMTQFQPSVTNLQLTSESIVLQRKLINEVVIIQQLSGLFQLLIEKILFLIIETCQKKNVATIATTLISEIFHNCYSSHNTISKTLMNMKKGHYKQAQCNLPFLKVSLHDDVVNEDSLWVTHNAKKLHTRM